jgi:hypothetical protein
MVKTVCELYSRVKIYCGKTEKQKDGSACMYACMCQVVGRWEVRACMHQVGGRREVGTWLVGWLG